MENINFNNYLFRCSSLGKFIIEEKINLDGSIRKGSGTVTDGIQTELKKIYFEAIKGYRKDFGSKYTEKGNLCEEDSITMLQKTIFRGKLLVKNKKRNKNKYIIGLHDVEILKIIVDNKNCFDWITLTDAELTKLYEWQLRGYMMINDCNEAILFYSLLNMPEQMLQDEERKMFYAQKKWVTMEDPNFLAECDKLREMYNFEKYPVWERFKSFKIERDLAKEELIIASVLKCRIWLNNYHKEQLELHKGNRLLMGLTD